MAISAETELALDPSIERARELAREANAIPVRLSFVDDCETPVSAFLKLRTEGPCFLLESAEQGRLGRYSFLGFSPRAVLRWQDGVLSEWAGDAPAGAEPRASHAAPDPYAAVSDHLGHYRWRGLTTYHPSRAAQSGSSATTWSERWSRSASRTPTRSGCRTWR